MCLTPHLDPKTAFLSVCCITKRTKPHADYVTRERDTEARAWEQRAEPGAFLVESAGETDMLLG